MLSRLQQEVLNVYLAAEFNAPAHPNTLDMLQEIERKLDQLLLLKEQIVAEKGEEWIAEREKQREKERRDHARLKKAQEDKEDQERRARLIQERKERRPPVKVYSLSSSHSPGR